MLGRSPSSDRYVMDDESPSSDRYVMDDDTAWMPPTRAGDGRKSDQSTGSTVREDSSSVRGLGTTFLRG